MQLVMGNVFKWLITHVYLKEAHLGNPSNMLSLAMKVETVLTSTNFNISPKQKLLLAINQPLMYPNIG